MAASVKTDDLKKAVKSILRDADLDSLSAKKVRRKLEEKFDIDLSERKKEIDEMVMKMVTDGVDDDDDETEKPAKTSKNPKSQTPADKISKVKNDHVTQNGSRKRGSGDNESEGEDSGNDSDSSFDEPDPEPVVKKKKTQAKPAPKPKKKTADSGDEDRDEELAKKLQEEEDMNLRTRRRPQKKAPAPRKPKEKKERKGTSMYSKPCQLSPELAAVMGADQLSRHEIVKRMWEEMKKRELQDPKNKQFMICDEQMHKIFGKKRVRMFGMLKWLSKHIKNVDDLVD